MPLRKRVVARLAKFKPWMVSIFAVQVKRAENLLNDASIGEDYTTICELLHGQHSQHVEQASTHPAQTAETQIG